MSNQYYVYLFLDPRKLGTFYYEGLDISFRYEPFYVGKGLNNRYTRHLNQSQLNAGDNTIKEGKLKNILASGFNPLDYIVIIASNLDEQEALNIESQTILSIGRIINDTGPLSNLAEGGTSTSVMTSKLKGKTYVEIYGKERAHQLVAIRREAVSGHKNPMYGKVSPTRGKSISDERKQKLRELHGKSVYQIDRTTLEIIAQYSSAVEAAQKTGILKSCIHNCLSPNQPAKTAGGFIWRYVD